MWTKPSYQDMRLGFEITMYFQDSLRREIFLKSKAKWLRLVFSPLGVLS